MAPRELASVLRALPTKHPELRAEAEHIATDMIVRTAKGLCFNVLLVIDPHTKEILEPCACDTRGPTAEWTIRTSRLGVTPKTALARTRPRTRCGLL